jgi:hypothetical protein
MGMRWRSWLRNCATSRFAIGPLEFFIDIIDNLNNVRRGASRLFRNKKKVYLKSKIEEMETNSKINNIRDLYRGNNNVKKGYRPRTRIVKDEKRDLVADFHSIMVRWKNYFSQILNV